MMIHTSVQLIAQELINHYEHKMNCMHPNRLIFSIDSGHCLIDNTVLLHLRSSLKAGYFAAADTHLGSPR